MAKTYLAQDKANGITMVGGLSACLSWAAYRVAQHPKSNVIIIRVRPSEDGKIIAEVDNNGGRWLFDGRYIPKRDITKMVKQVAINAKT
jgi:hypothetical protein